MTTYTILNKRIREKDLPNFTRQLFKNRQKDRRIKMEKEKKFEVSQEKFDTYVKIQKSGVTNMWAVSVVVKVSKMFYETELTKEDCLYIMKNYGALLAEYK